MKRIICILIPIALLGGCAAKTPMQAEKHEGVVHVMKKGQTLYRLSVVYDVPVDVLMKVNGIDDPADIPSGSKILIPGAEKLADMEVYDSDRPRFIYPVEGIITSHFGIRHGRMHRGIDISAPRKTSVKAAAAGTVIHAGKEQRGYGKCILVDHGDGFKTRYAHCCKILTSKGKTVKQGDIIGRVGKTGRATGCHLHFEIIKDGTAVNPLPFIDKAD